VILAVTHAKDDHAPAVLGALARQGVEAAVLDLGALPRGGRFFFHHATPGPRALRLRGQPEVEAEAVTALWWRRPRPLRAAPGLPALRAEASVRQTLDAVMGLVASLEGQALLVNHPWRDDVATQKTLQLAAAERAGLALPATLVTNELAAARAFLAAHRDVVHKTVRAAPADWRRTARVRSGALGREAGLPHVPVILQERVPGVDVRVTVVGEALFAAEIDARDSSSPDDYRGVERQCRFAPCRLPAQVDGALRRLVKALGLTYGAADFRRRDDGAWFFLEVNPGGQWLFVEERTGQPITAALANLLARGERRRRHRSRAAAPPRPR